MEDSESSAGTDSAKYREYLVQTHHTASRDFDKLVTTLAAGGLALSITFVHDIAPNPTAVCVLALAWSSFVVSLLALLVSLITSQRALLDGIEHIDKSRLPQEWKSRYWRATTALNLAAAIALVIAAALLVAFALANVGRSSNATEKTKASPAATSAEEGREPADWQGIRTASPSA